MAYSVPFASLVTGIMICWLGYIVIKTYISVFFGPLSKFPGPKLAAATRYVSSRHKLRGTEYTYIHQLHLKYGPIVRVGPNELSFTDSRAWKDINGRFNGVYAGVKTGQFQKDSMFYGFSPPGYLELINANDEDHARMRRSFSHAFSEKALRQQEPMVRRYVDILIEKMADTATEPQNQIDLVKYFNWTTFDIMSDLTSGEPLGCLAQSDYHPWVAMIFSVFKIVPFVQEINCYPWLHALFEWATPKSVREEFMQNYKYADEAVEKRLAIAEARPDIWGAVMQAKDEYRLTKPEMCGNLRLFMSAGTETSASLMSGLTYYLIQNPSKMALLSQEVRTTYGSQQDINASNLSTLPYLNACIEEGLRLFPPVAGFLPRVVPKGGATVCGELLPENVAVYVHPYAASHSPRNFKDPDSFRPERWLGDPEYADDDRNAVQPFSTGPRNCIGRNLAYVEMRLLLAIVVWHFDLSLQPESQGWLDQKVYIAWERPPLLVRLRAAGTEGAS